MPQFTPPQSGGQNLLGLALQMKQRREQQQQGDDRFRQQQNLQALQTLAPLVASNPDIDYRTLLRGIIPGGASGETLDALEVFAKQGKQRKKLEESKQAESGTAATLLGNNQADVLAMQAGLPVEQGPRGLDLSQAVAALRNGVRPEKVNEQTRIANDQFGQDLRSAQARDTIARNDENRKLAQEDSRKRANFLVTPEAAEQLGLPVGTRRTVVGEQNIRQFANAGAVQTGSATGIVDDAGSVLTKPTQGKLEQARLETAATLDTISSVRGLMDPRFFTVEGRAEILGINARIAAGQPVSSEEEVLVNQFSVAVQDSASLLNERIKQITGAQMSAQEAVRIGRELPRIPDNPLDLLKGDNFTNYMARLDNMEAKLRLHDRRMQFALQDGAIGPADIGADGTLNARGKRILSSRYDLRKMEQITRTRVQAEVRRLRKDPEGKGMTTDELEDMAVLRVLGGGS